jgi:pyruvate/2-oxoglutarate dehydrogenase complex dihydrolipoamide dehydrogenase (E3) component
MTLEELKPDILVIGAGSGGLSVAAGASQMGANVILLEHGKMGGDCLNTGCVPSKAFLAAAKQMHLPQGMGVTSRGVDLNPQDVFAHVHDVISQIEPHDSQERFEGLGVRVIRESGQFVSPYLVRAGEHVIRPKRTVIATGSSAFIPPIPELHTVSYLTNETVFNQDGLPEHLIVIGGGPIGIEMAYAHSRLGCRVTVIDAQTILSKDDPECVAILRQSIACDTLKLLEKTSIQTITQNEATREISVLLANGDVIQGDRLLVATGRRPNIETLNLGMADVQHSAKGITVDARLRTKNKSIFAIGDVVENSLQFTHMAGYHAGIVIRNILFKLPAKAKTHHIPWVTYTDPELAHVGISDSDLPQGGQIIRRSYAENDRARAERRTDGLVKVRVNKKGKILGASVVGLNAGELIQPWALAVSSGLSVKDMAGYVAPYPTLGEMNKHVAGSFYTPKLFSKRTQKIVKFLLKFLY